jgi:hypothetical protein
MDHPSKKKYTKHAVSYQYAPNGVERCSYCSMFKPAASCTDVDGVIDRNGWCQIYRPKTNPTERTGSVRLR